MELDELKTAGAFIGLFGILAAGTLMSPMRPTTVMMVVGGLLVFGVVTLVLGIKHGEYRASQ
jgi:purine-cytosine permease-like protein